MVVAGDLGKAMPPQRQSAAQLLDTPRVPLSFPSPGHQLLARPFVLVSSHHQGIHVGDALVAELRRAERRDEGLGVAVDALLLEEGVDALSHVARVLVDDVARQNGDEPARDG